MKLRAYLRPEDREDLAEAARWYEGRPLGASRDSGFWEFVAQWRRPCPERHRSAAGRRRMRGSLFGASALLAVVAGCQPTSHQTTGNSVSVVDDLSAARKSFVSRLRIRGPAPRPYRNGIPPAGVTEVEYPSGDLKLKGWLSAAAGDGRKRPAVVFLHGGWSLSEEDWENVAPFASAGFVLFMPALRAENGNPGSYESFLGEVDDAIAAGRYASSLPGVDPNNVFVAGHSVGGVLTCLVSMLRSPNKAAASFDGYMDMESWAAGSTDAQVPYDGANPEEVRVRNPMAVGPQPPLHSQLSFTRLASVHLHCVS